jgi:hypothetical protein
VRWIGYRNFHGEASAYKILVEKHLGLTTWEIRVNKRMMNGS